MVLQHYAFALAASEDGTGVNDENAIAVVRPLVREDGEARVPCSFEGTPCYAMAEPPVVPILTNSRVSHKHVECNRNGVAALVQVMKVLPGKYRVAPELISNEEPAAPTSDTQTTSHKNTETAAACPSLEKTGSDPDLDETRVERASANGVDHYEMGFPDVLRPPADCNDKMTNGSETSLHAYAIHCPVLHEGMDHTNVIPPTQFVLLNHFALDEEIVTRFYVRLNLPHQECVIAHLSARGIVQLTADQVKAAKIFNGLLFNFICGRSSSNTVSAENKVKGYYLLPLKDEADLGTKANSVTLLIDWAVALNFVNWKFNMREWAFYKANPGLVTTQVLLHNDSATHEKRHLRLKCGIYEEDGLIDAFVSYGPWNSRCFITGVAKELCALSFMQGNQSGLTFKDYWQERFKVELQYLYQPLLIGYSLSRAGNFLLRPSQEALWCNAKAKRVILPPEVCILQAGLKGTLWRGAFRLPSILHGLESALLAAQLRDLIGAQISAFKFQEALTSGAYNVYQSYERFELVGDSYLTLVGAAALYVKDSSLSKEDLASSLHALVRNKKLFQCAKESGLTPYVFNETFQIRGWLPPGLMCERLHQVENKALSACLRRQRISWRTLADVVEAIVGACVMYGKTEDAVKAILWLRIPIQYPEKSACSLPLKIGVEIKNSISTRQIGNLERQINFQFKNRDLVFAALCYSSGDCDGDLQFSRLAFLGDCILSHHVGRHFLTAHQTLDEGTVNEMKQSVINKESLACAAVRNRLHGFITGLDTAHKESIMAYALMLEKENLNRDGFPAFGLVGVPVPRGLCDLVSAIAAAIFLDCELDSELVWKVVRPLLEPLPEPGSFSMHPVNELTQFCRTRLLSLDIQSTAQGGVYEQFRHCMSLKYARKGVAARIRASRVTFICMV
ncbi:hypothetical protein GOP47_0002422 [Adiantum capillus-veneris]|uniref:Uncharacterized protein n=1 Tax=Adiantum capillus-veneris TaxID=13818 RepID=A0A9D4VAC1_ADICA|nr:hypothetical protein GOP47_0002422 [Adiantum capillus-veneris]